MRTISLAREISLHRSVLYRTLELKQRDLSSLQEQLSTGKQINRASDDSTGFARAGKLSALAGRYGQFQRSIGPAQSWVTNTEDHLAGLSDLFTTAYESGVQAANDTLGTDEREAIAVSLESTFASILDEANTRVGDGYLFGGSNTTTKPFEQDSSGSADGAGITYYGNDSARSRAVGPDLKLDINTTGESLRDTGKGFTVFEAVKDLIDAVRSGDSTQIQSALDDTITARDHVLGVASAAGETANRLNQAGDFLTNALVNVENQRSQVEDADISRTIMELNKTQVGLQATLQVMSSLQQNSLLNFLR